MSSAQLIEEVEAQDGDNVNQWDSDGIKRLENREYENGTGQEPGTSNVEFVKLTVKSTDLSKNDLETSNSFISVSTSNRSKVNALVYSITQQDATPSSAGRREMSIQEVDLEVDTGVGKDQNELSRIAQEQTTVEEQFDLVESVDNLDTTTPSNHEVLTASSHSRNENVEVITQQPRSERSADIPISAHPLSNFTPPPTQEPTTYQHVQPPSYTSVEIRRPSISFVPPVPPPSYGEAMGIEHMASPRPPPLILNVAPSVWSHRAQPAYCRTCHAVVISKIKHRPCTFTHMAAGLLFLFMYAKCWPFCVLPYCINYCQQAMHHCPGCNQILGTYNPIV